MPDNNHHFLAKVYGHQKAKNFLSGFLDTNKVPHSIIFTGAEGIGKDYLAVQFAKSLHSSTITINSGDDIISKINNLEEPYIKYIFPLPRAKNETEDSGPTEKFSDDELELLREEISIKINNPYHKISLPKANNIKINSIRDIRKFLSLEYGGMYYRVILISDAHLMSEEAQNALLKNLEEPPEKVVFLITTSQPSGLRKTVLSRCWRISLDSLSDNDVVKILTEYFKVDKSIAENVAPFAEGSVTVAMKLIDMDFMNLKEKTISILRNAFGKKYYTAYDELNSLIVEDPATNLEAVIKMIIIWLNDLNRYRLNQDQFFFRDHIETLQKFQEKFPTVGINELLFELDNFSNLINRNINTNTLSSNLIFQLSNLISEKHSN